jgi:hypothetical protein
MVANYDKLGHNCPVLQKSPSKTSVFLLFFIKKREFFVPFSPKICASFCIILKTYFLTWRPKRSKKETQKFASLLHFFGSIIFASPLHHSSKWCCLFRQQCCKRFVHRPPARFFAVRCKPHTCRFYRSDKVPAGPSLSPLF